MAAFSWTSWTFVAEATVFNDVAAHQVPLRVGPGASPKAPGHTVVMTKKSTNESNASAISRWENEGGALGKSAKRPRSAFAKLPEASAAKKKASHPRLSRGRQSKR